MTKKEFLKRFDEYILNNDEVINICLVNPNMKDTETITFCSCDFEYKRNYYNTVYDSEMRLKSFNKIRIINIC